MTVPVSEVWPDFECRGGMVEISEETFSLGSKYSRQICALCDVTGQHVALIVERTVVLQPQIKSITIDFSTLNIGD